MLKGKTDEELMRAYQAGDEAAFRELYERHAPRVLAYLRSKLGAEAKARDVFQGTFLKLHKTRDRYNPVLPFVPWLFTICRSELLDSLRKESRNREIAVAEPPEWAVPEPAPGPVLDLAFLSESQRRAVELRYGDGFSFEEIARVLETTPANARQVVSRAVKHLRRLYGQEN